MGSGQPHRPIWGAVAAALLGFLLSTSVTAAIIFEDNFDSEAPGFGTILNYGTSTGALANWDVTAGDVDLIASGEFNITCVSAKCLDLDGTSGSAGRIETKANFTPGTYTLSFTASGNQRDLFRGPDSITVSFGNLVETFEFEATDPFQTFVRVVTVGAGGTDKLVFDHAGSGGGSDQLGAILDNVFITDTIDISEPGGLFIAALAVFGLLRRRSAV